MKLTILIFSISLTLLVGLANLNTHNDISIGYFIVSGAGLISLAFLNESANKPEKRYDSITEIYSKIAASPLEIDALIEELVPTTTASYDANERKVFYKQQIGLMINSQDLIIRDGKVCIPKQTDNSKESA